MNGFKVFCICAALACRAMALEGDADGAVPAAEDWSRIYLAENPTVSPDGSEIAFDWCGRIWRASSSGGVASPLTSGDPVDAHPVWSPDGNRIIFSTQRDGYVRIYEMPLDEGGAALAPRPVTSHSEGMTLCSFAPDGRFVAVALRDSVPEARVSGANTRRAYFVATNGAEELIFDAPACEVSVSPDGRRVLFATTGDTLAARWRKRRPGSTTPANSDVWLYDIETKTFTALADTRADEREPLWRPDGEGFYFLSDEGGVRNIWFKPLSFAKDGRCKGGKALRLTGFTDANVMQCALSADGRTLVFRQGFDFRAIDPTQKKPEVRTIFLKPSAPVARRTIQRAYAGLDNDYGYGNCSFTPEGEAAFTAAGDVHIVSSSHQEPVSLTNTSLTHERDCVFSPDGDTLYWLSDRGDGTEIWAATRTQSSRSWTENKSFNKRLVLGGDECRRLLSVSPNGKRLAWMGFNGELHFADADGSNEYISAPTPYIGEEYCWSPDGKYVAATLSDCNANRDIWIIPTRPGDGDSPKPYNLSRHFLADRYPAWSPDGRIIAFCGMRSSGGDFRIFYAYLDPADEAAEARGHIARRKPCRPSFKELAGRVRDTGVKGKKPFFSHDGRTLMFNSDGNVKRISLPLALTPQKTLETEGDTIMWSKGHAGERVYRVVEGFPAYGDQRLSFYVFKTIDVADYQELCFRSAWANVRDGFCDESWHGTPWLEIRDKYLAAARNAPSWGVFSRVISSMYGEIDASHLDISANATVRKRWPEVVGKNNWQPDTASLGVRFDQAHEGRGWLVKDVIPMSPADAGSRGLVAGDIVLSVDGVEVSGGMDYAKAVNNTLPHKYILEVKRGDEKIERRISGISFTKARELLRDAARASIRERCHAEANCGYIAIDAFDDKAAQCFTDEAFAEMEGRDCIIIDIRGNIGGHSADKLIDILCGKRHNRMKMRGVDGEGFVFSRVGRPIYPDIPVVTIIDSASVSNAEEFAHAMKTLGRGVLVGKETAGMIIGTTEKELFDYGMVNCPSLGFFTPDGCDMEWHGAKPDVDVARTPADIAAGRDPQLDAAIAEAKKLARGFSRRTPPPLKYSR